LQGLGDLLATYLPEYGNLITSHTAAPSAAKRWRHDTDMCPGGHDTARGTSMACFSGLQAQTAVRCQPAQCV